MKLNTMEERELCPWGAGVVWGIVEEKARVCERKLCPWGVGLECGA